MQLMERDDVRAVRGMATKGDAITLAALAAGGVALLFIGWKVARIAMRASGPVGTALTIAGIALWVREQLTREELEAELE